MPFGAFQVPATRNDPGVQVGVLRSVLPVARLLLSTGSWFRQMVLSFANASG